MVIDSIFYLVIIFMGGGLTLLGMTSKIGILNLLSIPFWLFLAIQWSDEPILILAMVGLMLFEIVYLIKTFNQGGE